MQKGTFSRSHTTFALLIVFKMLNFAIGTSCTINENFMLINYPKKKANSACGAMLRI